MNASPDMILLSRKGSPDNTDHGGLVEFNAMELNVTDPVPTNPCRNPEPDAAEWRIA